MMKTASFFGISLASRGNRRFVVALMYTMFVALFVVGGAGKAQNLPWMRLLAIAPALIAIAAYFAVYRFTRRYAIKTSHTDPIEADEREARVRDYAMARSYLYMSAAILLGTLWMSIAADAPGMWAPRTGKDWTGVMVVLLIVNSTVPQAIITCSEPDLAGGDSEIV